MCDWIFNNDVLFRDKSVCELGCGLGAVSILLAKLNVARQIIATDGDDDTIDLLNENIVSSGCVDQIVGHKLWWGATEAKTFLSQGYSEGGGFDVLIAADVIYEEEQIVPLIESSIALMKKGTYSITNNQLPITSCYCVAVDTGVTYLSFFPRNVPLDKVIAVAESHSLSWEELTYAWSVKRAGSKLERLVKLYFA